MKKVLFLFITVFSLCFSFSAFAAADDIMLLDDDGGQGTGPLNEHGLGAGGTVVIRDTSYSYDFFLDISLIYVSDSSFKSAYRFYLPFGVSVCSYLDSSGFVLLSKEPFKVLFRSIDASHSEILSDSGTSSSASYNSTFDVYKFSFSSLGVKMFCDYKFFDANDFTLSEIITSYGRGTLIVDPITSLEGNSSGGGSSGGGSIAFPDYDAGIPAPKNFRASMNRSTGAISLYWTSPSGDESDQFCCRIVGYGNLETGDMYHHETYSSTKIFHSLEKDGETPYSSSNGGFTCNMSDFDFTLGENQPVYATKAYYPTKFKLQYYQHVNGVMKAGPTAVCTFSITDSEKLDRYISQIETPDGISGSDVYDNSGNLVGSSPGSGSSGGSGGTGGSGAGSGGSGSVGDVLTGILNSFLNFPSVITGFFQSFRSLADGLGVLPTFLSEMFSFLPSEILTIIGLGLTVVVLLRILGR